MDRILAVAAGGALGSVARYLVTTMGQFASPWTTMLINVLGSFAMGFLAYVLAQKFVEAEGLRAFVLTGVLGGFTTFSAFSLDVMQAMQRGENAVALIYVLGSVMLSILAVFGGAFVSRMVFA